MDTCHSCSCGHDDKNSEEKKTENYKCESCGQASSEEKECCGLTMNRACDCGSGKFSESCCKS